MKEYMVHWERNFLQEKEMTKKLDANIKIEVERQTKLKFDQAISNAIISKALITPIHSTDIPKLVKILQTMLLQQSEANKALLETLTIANRPINKNDKRWYYYQSHKKSNLESLHKEGHEVQWMKALQMEVYFETQAIITIVNWLRMALYLLLDHVLEWCMAQ